MNNNTIYLVTGAAGFMGSHICDELIERGDKVRALVLPGDKSVKFIPPAVEIVEGNLCDMKSLDGFFSVPEGFNSIVIHVASLVTVNPEYNQKLMDINVGGTKNMIDQVLAHSECEKMIYVSSTGAIPEFPKGTRIGEIDKFNPDKVIGWYSKSKALATQLVLDSVKRDGLKACVVHPTGILGPKDYAIGTTTGVVIEIMKGKMPMGMAGSFNLVDVRDLAHGTIMAADKGRIGECYILGAEEITFKHLCKVMKQTAPECKPPKAFLPLGMAFKMAKSMEKKAEKTGKMPLMTTDRKRNRLNYSQIQKPH